MSDQNNQSSIQVGDIKNAVGVAIGHGASGVINQIIQGLGDLPTHYDGPVRNFLEYYLGAADSPAPFGGRQADLTELNAWLADPSAPPYLFLSAPAGRGKSALIAQWVAQLQGRADLDTAFFPISLRFSTNRENVVFAALYARLAQLFGERATQALDVQLYRGAFDDYLRRPLPNGKRLLIILDGLDEAAGWEAGSGLFPTAPPPHLRVVVSARVLGGDLDWLTQLGWESPSQAREFALARLTLEGVREALAAMRTKTRDWMEVIGEGCAAGPGTKIQPSCAPPTATTSPSLRAPATMGSVFGWWRHRLLSRPDKCAPNELDNNHPSSARTCQVLTS